MTKPPRKIISLAISLIVFFSVIYFFWPISSSYDSQGYCAFCDHKILSYQRFYEDELVSALYTHKPILDGHILVIPKRHVERFEMLSEMEIAQINCTLKKIHIAAVKTFNTNSYLLLQKNGAEVGQTVPHVHFHYIPRPYGDDSTLKFFFRFYIANFQPPISASEMHKVVEKMKVAMQE